MKKKIAVALLICFFAVSCQDTKALEEINDDQALILNKLKSLDKKLQDIEKKIDDIPDAPIANKKNDKKKPPKPESDPNKVYNVADAGSVILGNPNAAVTVIKWTDFQ